MGSADDVYSFVFKGLLTEEAVDRTGLLAKREDDFDNKRIAELVGIASLDDELVDRAKSMAIVYVAVAAFENAARRLIVKVLTDTGDADWWEKYVSKNIREVAQKRIEEEEKVRWHGQRGSDPIQFTMLPNLLNIMRNNLPLFEPFIHDIDWAANVFDSVERSRNVIMHSGWLHERDIARLGSLIRDWSAQVAV
jgi:hypothetical protein